MATLTTQNIKRTGLSGPVYSAAGGTGDKFTPDSTTFLHLKNTNAATRTVTAVTPNDTPGLPDVAVADPSVVVPATIGDVMWGPFPAGFFANPVDGLCSITYDATAGLTVAVLKVTQP